MVCYGSTLIGNFGKVVPEQSQISPKYSVMEKPSAHAWRKHFATCPLHKFTSLSFFHVNNVPLQQHWQHIANGFDDLPKALASDLGPNGRINLNTKVDAILRPGDLDGFESDGYYNTHHDNTHGYRYGYGFDNFNGHQNHNEPLHGPHHDQKRDGKPVRDCSYA